MNRLQQCMTAVAALSSLFVGSAWGAGRLDVEAGWIRPAPPGVSMLAGYARLHNGGDAPVRVTAVESTAFGAVSIHETTLVDGVSRMRELAGLSIDAGASATLEPGGKHLMLMEPAQAIETGGSVRIVFVLDDGSRVPAEFTVADRAPATGHGHTDHDHAGHAH